jgi:hypothetical protein
MPADQARRGRPKGSGLDDTDQLKRVARMLEADPGLKPTTAIKAIGISDPSTIRRLRDKLRGSGADLEDAETGAGNFARGGDGQGRRRGEAITAAQGFGREYCISGETAGSIEGAECDEAGLPQRERRRDAGVSWFAAWCGLGLQALSTTVETQMAIFESFLSVPQIASAIRQQALLNEQVIAFYSQGTDVRNTLH